MCVTMHVKETRKSANLQKTTLYHKSGPNLRALFKKVIRGKKAAESEIAVYILIHDSHLPHVMRKIPNDHIFFIGW